MSTECCTYVFFREVHEELRQIARERASNEICLSLIEEGVLDELQELAEEVLEEEKAERDAKLQQLASHVKRKRTAQYFKRFGMFVSLTFLKYKFLKQCKVLISW